MKVEEIKEIARQRGVKAVKLKKGELVRAIQESEGNPTCFDTGAVNGCSQADCLWRQDCN